MAPVEWSSKLEIHPLFDEAHKQLTARINKLELLCHEEPSALVAADAVDDLGDAIVAHMREEEALMHKAAFPRYIPHKIEHDRFMNQLKDYAVGLREGEAALSMDTTLFIRTWFFDHVMSIDKEFAEWLRQKGLV